MAEPVYEMVWDCRFCGARKLLGLTHRHCPSCGAAQDPNGRYFPADDEKVAVQDHEYVGADVQCRYCNSASSSRAKCCGQCGAPLGEGAQVRAQPPPPAERQAFAAAKPAAPPPRALWKIVVPISALLGVAVVVVLLVWKKDQSFVVASHGWSRSINVERMGPSHQSSWCNELPAGAANVSRHREQRGTQQVSDGEDCHLQKKDQRDGTFKEEKICTPKVKDEPVYADKCDYVVIKWSQLRKDTVEGSGVVPAPHWPAVALTQTGCNATGCEREGTRDESYTVVLKDDRQQTYRCDFPENAWSGFADGQRYRGKLRALVRTLDCASLSVR